MSVNGYTVTYRDDTTIDSGRALAPHRKGLTAAVRAANRFTACPEAAVTNIFPSHRSPLPAEIKSLSPSPHVRRQLNIATNIIIRSLRLYPGPRRFPLSEHNCRVGHSDGSSSSRP